MSDLDEKILSILIRYKNWQGEKPIETVQLELIKQAFLGAGYIEARDWRYKGEPMKLVSLQVGDTVLMTGAEWFNRFKAELQRQGAPTLELRMAYPEEIEANVLEAARRAAGLTEDSK